MVPACTGLEGDTPTPKLHATTHLPGDAGEPQPTSGTEPLGSRGRDRGRRFCATAPSLVVSAVAGCRLLVVTAVLALTLTVASVLVFVAAAAFGVAVLRGRARLEMPTVGLGELRSDV